MQHLCVCVCVCVHVASYAHRAATPKAVQVTVCLSPQCWSCYGGCCPQKPRGTWRTAAGLLPAATGPLPSARSPDRSSFPWARHLHPMRRDPQCPPCHLDILGCLRRTSPVTGHSQSAGSCPRLGTAAGAGGEGAVLVLVLVLVLVERSVLRLTLVLLMLGVVRREMGLVWEVVLLRAVLLLDEGV